MLGALPAARCVDPKGACVCVCVCARIFFLVVGVVAGGQVPLDMEKQILEFCDF